jgi:hypothetical protein
VRVLLLCPLIALQFACTTPTLPKRYAHCADLGTLRLASTSADDAEQRMRAQVEILGGDLLLFNANGRAENGGPIPSALAQRRNALAATPAESINGAQPELAALTASVTADETAEERWYYGAALRCKPVSSVQ